MLGILGGLKKKATLLWTFMHNTHSPKEPTALDTQQCATHNHVVDSERILHPNILFLDRKNKTKTEYKGAVTSTSHYTALQLIGTNWRFFLRNGSLNKSRLSSCWKKVIKSILAASTTKCWMWWGVTSACKFGNTQTGALMSGDMIHPCGELGEAWAHLSKTINEVIVHSCYF